MRAHKKGRLKALLLSLIIVLTSSFGIVQTVFAAPTPDSGYTPPNLGVSQKLSDTLHAHQEYVWLRACLDHIDIDKISYDNGGDNEMDSWEWFKGGHSDVPDGSKLLLVGNSEGGGDSAILHCDTGTNVGAAFSLLGFNDPRKFFCQLPGAKFHNEGNFDQGNSQDMIDCQNNVDHHDWDNEGVSHSTMMAGFDKLVQSTPQGKTAAASASDAMQYLRYILAFENQCSPTYISAYPTDGTDPATGSSKFYKLPIVDPDGTVNYVYTYGNDDSTPVALYGPGNTDKYSGDNQTGYGTVYDCGAIAVGARRTAAAYANYVKNHPDDITAQDVGSLGGDSGNQGDIDTSCGGFIDTSHGVTGILTSPLRWLVCPMIKGFAGAASVLDNGINSMLCINEAQIFDARDTSSCSGSSDQKTVTAYKQAWNVFRVVALGLLAIAGLVMVLSQTMGLEFVDAYTIKKVLPRLLVAAIGVTLSWQLMEFFVTLTNLLGLGMRNLIYAPFAAAGIDKVALGGGGSAVALLTTGGAIALLGPLGILSLVATGLLAILVAFVVLVLRNIVVILLILTAPIAIVAYVLPNTQKIWAFWWDAFTKALMMFPIITAFIAAGRVFAAISTTQAENLNGVAALIANIVGFIAYFAPYFLIPLTLRFAGGALGTLGGFANDRSRGAFDRLKKFRGARSAYNLQRMQANQRFNPNSKLGSALNTAGGWATDPGSNLAYKARNVRGFRKAGYKVAGQIEHAQVEQSKQLFEELNGMGFNDKAYRLLSGAHGAGKDANGNWIDDGTFSSQTKERLDRAGLYGKRISNISDLSKAAEILGADADNSDGLGAAGSTEQIASNAIHASMGRMATLYQDPEMGKASTQGAGILGLAAHGFASSADLSTAANGMQEAMGTGTAQSIVNQAQLMGSRSRPETKNGYGVMYDQKTGKFVDGMVGNENIASRARSVLKTLNSQDLAGAKGGAFDAMAPTITEALAEPSKPGLSPEKQAQARGEAMAVRDQLFSWAGPYSHASVDIKAKAINYIEDWGRSDPEFAREWQRYQRIEDPENRRGGPQEPQDGGGPGGA